MLNSTLQCSLKLSGEDKTATFNKYMYPQGIDEHI